MNRLLLVFPNKRKLLEGMQNIKQNLKNCTVIEKRNTIISDENHYVFIYCDYFDKDDWCLRLVGMRFEYIGLSEEVHLNKNQEFFLKTRLSNDNDLQRFSF